MTVLLGNGKGGFSRAGGNDIPVPPAPFSVAIADHNGDHNPDIAVGHYSGQGTDPSKDGLSVLSGDGKGSFSLAQGSPMPVGHYPATVVAGDINGDGIADTEPPNTMDKTLTIYLGGKSEIRRADGSPLQMDGDARSLAIDDLNGDRKADIVVSCMDDADILVLLAR